MWLVEAVLRLWRKPDRFENDESGNVAIVFAVALLPLTMASAAAVEFNLSLLNTNRLQAATDAAVLAAAATGPNENLARIEAQRVFTANIGDAGDLSSPELSLVQVENGYEAVGTASRSLIFGTLLGRQSADLSTVGQASWHQQGVELVVAFDVTASMGFGTSWSDGIAALRRLMENLEGQTGSDEFFVSLIPFTDRINFGDRTDFYEANSWDGLRRNSWDGCVEPREQGVPGFPYALTDDPISDESFTPTAKGLSGGLWEWNRGPRCSRSEVVGPTNNSASVISGLNQRHRTGTGRFDVALAWGWRMLSPRWVNQWGVPGYPTPYEDPRATRRKILVLFTDGYTEAYRYEVGASAGAYGWNRGGEEGFSHMVDLCNRIKATGIELYVVYVNGNYRGEPYMRDCALDGGYFNVNDTQTLEHAFAKITTGVGRVRLTH